MVTSVTMFTSSEAEYIEMLSLEDGEILAKEQAQKLFDAFNSRYMHILNEQENSKEPSRVEVKIDLVVFEF